VHDGHALLGDPELVGLGRRVDVPVAERLVEQVVDRRSRVVADGVVRGVRLRVVVRRDLEVAARLEVDVTQLDASPGRPVGVARSSSQHRGDHDDQQQAPQRERDHESPVPGVHTGESRERVIFGVPAAARAQRAASWGESARVGAESHADDVEHGAGVAVDLGERHPGDRVGRPVDLDDARLGVGHDRGPEEQVDSVEVLEAPRRGHPTEVQVVDVQQVTHLTVDPALLAYFTGQALTR
jgi:hypothetical protein